MGVSNSPNGQVTGDTIFEYQQDGQVLKATYSGGGIQSGYMLGKVYEDGSLYFLYHHLDENQNLRSGCCFSRPKSWRMVAFDCMRTGSGRMEERVKGNRSWKRFDNS